MKNRAYSSAPFRKGHGAALITIPKKGEANLNFDFRGEDERRKLYQDDIEGYRFNTWFDSKEKFYGGPRIDDPVEELQAFCDADHLC